MKASKETTVTLVLDGDELQLLRTLVRLVVDDLADKGYGEGLIGQARRLLGELEQIG